MAICYKFNEWTLDIGAGCLYRDGSEKKLRRQLFNLLELFMTRQDQLVTYDDIFALSGVVALTNNQANRAVSDLRDILGDRRSNKYIETMYGRGYRFVAPVEILERADPEALQKISLSNREETEIGDRPFFRWLRRNLNTFPSTSYSARGRLERDILAFDAVFVSAAPTASGYDDPTLSEVAFAEERFRELMEPFTMSGRPYSQKKERMMVPKLLR